LLEVFDDAMRLDIYREEQMWRNGTHPSLQVQKQRQQRQMAPQQLPPEQQQKMAQEADGEHQGAVSDSHALIGVQVL
jgi:hypothetical protein